jgi:hypothetical protein
MRGADLILLHPAQGGTGLHDQEAIAKPWQIGYLAATKLQEVATMHKTLAPLLLLFSALPAFGQWPDFPTPGVPLTAAGQPDYQAPTPRTAEGHPDFSGLWEPWPRSAPGREATARNGGSLPAAAAGTPPAGTFFDLGANIDGGLPYQDWARELRDARVADGMKDNPDANCLPMGLTQLHLHPQPRKIIQLPHLIVMLYEGNQGLRQIYLDGRPLPDNDPQPWWYGYSVGHWEGDTLVVQTSGLRDDGWLDVNGSPQTLSASYTERFTRPDYGHMIVDVSIDDPTAYTAPFTVRMEHGLMLNTELIEFICNENEQSTQFFDP